MTSWTGNFGTGTLTWVFGCIAENLLARSLADTGLKTRYLRWVQDLPGCSCPCDGLGLREVSFSDGGLLELVARPNLGEFILTVDHPDFALALGLATTDPREAASGLRLSSLCVAHFEGNAQAAQAWADALREWLRDPALRVENFLDSDRNDREKELRTMGWLGSGNPDTGVAMC